MDRNQIICLFSPPIRERLSRLAIDFSNLYEIRLRIQGPLLLVYKGEEFFLGNDGKLCREEKQLLHVLLLFPEKFWKVSNHYSNSHKAWVSGRDIEKLNRLIAAEPAREHFLENLFSFL